MVSSVGPLPRVHVLRMVVARRVAAPTLLWVPSQDGCRARCADSGFPSGTRGGPMWAECSIMPHELYDAVAAPPRSYESAAGSGVRSAPRRALHRSFADLRVRHTVATAHLGGRSAGAERLRDRNRAAGGVGRGRRQRDVELEPLIVAEDAGDAFGRPAVPPLDDRSCRRAARQRPLGGREDRVALGEYETVRAVGARDGSLR